MADPKPTKVTLVALTHITHDGEAIVEGQEFEVEPKAAKSLLDARAARLPEALTPAAGADGTDGADGKKSYLNKKK